MIVSPGHAKRIWRALGENIARYEGQFGPIKEMPEGGGPTPRGSESRLRLHRTGPDGKLVQLTPRMNDPVQPGDVLYVRESIF